MVNTFFLALFLGVVASAVAQHTIKLTTTSAKLSLSVSSRDTKLDTAELFQFETAMSKLFHNELSEHTSKLDRDAANTHVIVTSVHVQEQTKTDGADLEFKPSLRIESILSVTFSDVGMYKAVKRSPILGGLEKKTAPNLSTILSQIVFTSDILEVLIESNLVSDDASIGTLSFDGSVNERGVTATETDIVSKKESGAGGMFFAGMFLTLLLVTIIGLGTYVYLKESGRLVLLGNKGDDASVHYDDFECAATTASGVLGLVGYHPQAEKENQNSNVRRIHRRRKKCSSDFGSTYASSAGDMISPTNSQVTCSMTKATKRPLGITSMSKLNSSRSISFLTPQKVKSDKLVLYDAERMTRT